MPQPAEVKAAKDTLVASLFELSKSAQEATNAVVDFFNVISDEQQSGSLKDLMSSLTTLTKASSAVSETPETPKAEKKTRKAKAPKDPNAPKKPLTAYFAYANELRHSVREEREAEGLPPLMTTELSQVISKKWNELPAEEKEQYKKKYQAELGVYNTKKDKYLADKEEKSHETEPKAEEEEQSPKKRKSEEPTESTPKREKGEEEKKKKRKDKKKKKQSDE